MNRRRRNQLQWSIVLLPPRSIQQMGEILHTMVLRRRRMTIV
jgi:hypothetical protein